MRDVNVLGVVFLTAALIGCDREGPRVGPNAAPTTADPAPIASAAASADHADKDAHAGDEAAATTMSRASDTAGSDPIAAVSARLGALPFVTGDYAEDGFRGRFVAFMDGDEPVAIFEEQDFGDLGAARVSHYFENGQWVGFEKHSRVYSASGSPSDGWYETAMTIVVSEGRYAGGSKTVNGAPSEPDEHEVRGAARTAADMKSRAQKVAQSKDDDAAELRVEGMLVAGAPVVFEAGARAEIMLVDAARQDVAADILDRIEVALEQLPARFSLATKRSAIPPQAALRVSARVYQDEQLAYVTASAIIVDQAADLVSVTAELTATPPPDLDLMPGTGAGGMMITPPQDPYECAGERLLIAIEAGAAFITFDDRTTIRLDLLDSAAAGVRQFSSGRATLFIDADDAISFARGRAAPQSCSRL